MHFSVNSHHRTSHQNAEEHGASYKDLLSVRRRFITKEQLAEMPLGEWSMQYFVSDIRTSRVKGLRPAPRIEKVRCLGSKPHYGVARGLRQERHDDLLARRTQIDRHSFTVENLFFFERAAVRSRTLCVDHQIPYGTEHVDRFRRLSSVQIDAGTISTALFGFHCRQFEELCVFYPNPYRCPFRPNRSRRS